jgi:hypothetical protein
MTALPLNPTRAKRPEPQGAPAELRQLARAVRRIHDPMRANPEAVFEAKDAIAARLIRLADQMEAAR